MQYHDDYVVIIPARYSSSRLPGKPLLKISGVEMIMRTYSRCAKAVDPKKIFVATESSLIKNFCIKNSIQVIMTSDKCLTGTDRIAEVSTKISAPVYINVQGDEPLLNPDDLLSIINASMQKPNTIFNGYCEINDKDQYLSKNIPKAVFTEDKKLLYMSRSPIPFSGSIKSMKAFRQVCIYAFPRKALKIFSNNPKKTFFEMIEDIEILRFLELGCEINMVKMSSDSVAVDVPDDIKRVEKLLSLRNE
jgi:3-deoxy-manno-octulosonate cytidylyltransferase (CMP-KDO synthetase)